MKELIEAKKQYEKTREELKYRINYWLSEKEIFTEFYILKIDYDTIQLQGYSRNMTLEEIEDFQKTFHVRHDTSHKLQIIITGHEAYWQYTHFFSYTIFN